MTEITRAKKWADAGKEIKDVWAAGARPQDKRFQLVADFKMTGDQPQAVARLAQGVNDGAIFQTMLGVTGSGKTFTMANIVQEVQRPTIVMAHNKTLAAQLASEFKEFFPQPLPGQLS